MPISQKRLEQAVRQARALRSDRIEIHVSPYTLEQGRDVFDSVRAVAAHSGGEVTIAADSMVPAWCVQCRNLEDRRHGRVPPLVDVRETKGETMHAGG